MALLIRLLLAFALSTAILASPHGSRNLYPHPHRALVQRAPINVHVDTPIAPPRKRSLNKRCIPRPSNATTAPTHTPTPPPSSYAPENVAGAPSSPPSSANNPTPTPPSYPTPSTTSSPPPSQSGSSSGGNGYPNFFNGMQYGYGTFFDDGLGACGYTNTGSDLIVAVAENLFDSYPGYDGSNPNKNPVCGRKVNVYYNAMTITATVVDRCTGCRNVTSLDFSRGAFGELTASAFDLGIVGIAWSWA